jgi:hypothetical protein
MHTALRTELGEAEGEELINVLAPLERGELALRSDVVELRGEIARLEGKIDRLEGEIKGMIGELRGSIDSQVPKLLCVMVPIMVSLVALVFAAVRL